MFDGLEGAFLENYLVNIDIADGHQNISSHLGHQVITN